jgi:hypothetical protein
MILLGFFFWPLGKARSESGSGSVWGDRERRGRDDGLDVEGDRTAVLV